MSLSKMSGVWYGQTGAPVSQAIPIFPMVIEFLISQAVSIIVMTLVTTSRISPLLFPMHKLDTDSDK